MVKISKTYIRGRQKTERWNRADRARQRADQIMAERGPSDHQLTLVEETGLAPTFDRDGRHDGNVYFTAWPRGKGLRPA